MDEVPHYSPLQAPKVLLGQTVRTPLGQMKQEGPFEESGTRKSSGAEPGRCSAQQVDEGGEQGAG